MHPDLLVGTAASDDAGVFRLPDGRALVQTVDFFTPVVDDPYDWGRIAAANALSDLYAMGARPITALQMVGWPRDVIPYDVLHRVLEGGADVMATAGCTIVGGHTIDDPEPKYGFAVSGLAEPDEIVTNAGARAGDVLVLTKPLGTGIIATAIKRGACPVAVAENAVAVMASLNRAAAEGMLGVGVSAATDVTGFGLLGHLTEVAVASGIAVRVDPDAVPVLDGAWSLLDAGFYPGGSERNVEAVRERIVPGADERTVRMLCDAQTSGGLLISVPSNRAARLLERLPDAVVVGGVVDGAPGSITLG